MSGDTTDLLFELGTEELPAGPLMTMATALSERITGGLGEHGLGFEDCQTFATPRRLGVLVLGVQLTAAAREQTLLGPPAKAARDSEGNWTPAALGFARKQGVEPEELQSIDTDKGPRLGLIRTEAGAELETVAPGIIAGAVAAIPVAKRMRWGRQRHEFLRPVQWLVALLGETVVELSLFGLSAGRTTRGHRFHHPDTLTISAARDYPETLALGQVLGDFEARRTRIESQVCSLAEAEGLVPVIDPDLLDEVTGLVEWPVALMGRFDSQFLSVPAEALVSSMKEHQKYFHLVDHEGQLQPFFIAISNIESSDPSQVIAGNEKVIRPRLSDAAFFFETDKQTSLESRETQLERVVFQQALGTLADKQARIRRLAAWLAPQLDCDAGLVERAASLCKCDLVTDMVLEFPELQGIAGAHYARHDGEPEVVVSAIEQHYWPRHAGDHLPDSAEAACVALADRLDTLAGIFGLGQTPTGSKDPFALRRASLAVIRLLVHVHKDLDLHDLVRQAVAGYPSGVLAEGTDSTVRDYTLERLRALYEDQGIGVDVLRSVTGTGLSVPAEIDRRVHALKVFAGTEAATALAAANKRVANILAKSERADIAAVDPELFESEEEAVLLAAIETARDKITPLVYERNYGAAFEALAGLRGPVDTFFDAVMVNADDPRVRANRLGLLAQLRETFLRLADIAHLSPTG